ncbi:MAG: hypothetical protein ACRDQ5_21715, partial [Sciscionella sp.]
MTASGRFGQPDGSDPSAPGVASTTEDTEQGRDTEGTSMVPRGEYSDHRWGLGAFLLVEAVFLLSAVFLSAILEPSHSTALPVSTVLVGTIVPTVLAAGVAILVTVVLGNGPVADLR